MIGVLLLSLGVIAELLKSQRKLTEENLFLLRKREWSAGNIRDDSF
jgi:hypothetical protein